MLKKRENERARTRAWMKNDLARLLQQSIYLMNHRQGKVFLSTPTKGVATIITLGNVCVLALVIWNLILAPFRH